MVSDFSTTRGFREAMAQLIRQFNNGDLHPSSSCEQPWNGAAPVPATTSYPIKYHSLARIQKPVMGCSVPDAPRHRQLCMGSPPADPPCGDIVFYSALDNHPKSNLIYMQNFSAAGAGSRSAALQPPGGCDETVGCSANIGSYSASCEGPLALAF